MTIFELFERRVMVTYQNGYFIGLSQRLQSRLYPQVGTKLCWTDNRTVYPPASPRTVWTKRWTSHAELWEDRFPPKMKLAMESQDHKFEQHVIHDPRRQIAVREIPAYRHQPISVFTMLVFAIQKILKSCETRDSIGLFVLNLSILIP